MSSHLTTAPSYMLKSSLLAAKDASNISLGTGLSSSAKLTSTPAKTGESSKISERLARLSSVVEKEQSSSKPMGLSTVNPLLSLKQPPVVTSLTENSLLNRLSLSSTSHSMQLSGCSLKNDLLSTSSSLRSPKPSLAPSKTTALVSECTNNLLERDKVVTDLTHDVGHGVDIGKQIDPASLELPKRSVPLGSKREIMTDVVEKTKQKKRAAHEGRKKSVSESVEKFNLLKYTMKSEQSTSIKMPLFMSAEKAEMIEKMSRPVVDVASVKVQFDNICLFTFNSRLTLCLIFIVAAFLKHKSVKCATNLHMLCRSVWLIWSVDR